MTSNSDYIISIADWKKQQAEISAIRRAVFIEEQGVPESLEWDGLDDDAIQLIATTNDGAVTGTARILPTGQIGRMAVLPAYRGRGIGKALLDESIKLGSGLPGIDRIFLNAQTAVQGLYESAGFIPVGGIFIEADIPHIRMELEI